MIKVLVVDDDKEVTDYVVEFLNSVGYSAECAYDSDEAMEKIRENKPDCILLDVQMSGSMDGFDVLEKAAREK